jgi:hypothetical protein
MMNMNTYNNVTNVSLHYNYLGKFETYAVVIKCKCHTKNVVQAFHKLSSFCNHFNYVTEVLILSLARTLSS